MREGKPSIIREIRSAWATEERFLSRVRTTLHRHRCRAIGISQRIRPRRPEATSRVQVNEGTMRGISTFSGSKRPCLMGNRTGCCFVSILIQRPDSITLSFKFFAQGGQSHSKRASRWRAEVSQCFRDDTTQRQYALFVSRQMKIAFAFSFLLYVGIGVCRTQRRQRRSATSTPRRKRRPVPADSTCSIMRASER